ncbi:hypothetical protein RhiirA5_358012, partial [Rhizophagus irregularis]
MVKECIWEKKIRFERKKVKPKEEKGKKNFGLEKKSTREKKNSKEKEKKIWGKE